MEIYIDFRNVHDKANIAQAIKVFAMTYKDDDINVITDDNSSTLIEKNNLHILKEFDLEKLKYVYCFNDNLIPENAMKLIFLNTNSSEKNFINFGDLNNNNLSVEDKFAILKKYGLISDENKYAIMTSTLGLNNDFKTFIENHKEDSNFEGSIMPKDIANSSVNTILTTFESASIFLESLLYAIEFLNLKEEERDSKESVFTKLFSFNKSGPRVIS